MWTLWGAYYSAYHTKAIGLLRARSTSLPKTLWEEEQHSVTLREQGLNGSGKIEERRPRDEEESKSRASLDPGPGLSNTSPQQYFTAL